MSGGEGRLKGIVEGDEVGRFLAQFVVSDAERAALKAQDPKANVDALPKNADQVLNDVKEIWERRGFTTPAELKAQLIEKYTPGADPKVIDYIRQVESARMSPETTTGYLGKEHAYITTGLAHLYAKETGKPIAMVEADFSNMGGTNTHFEEMLKKQNLPGVTAADIKHQAMHMTDQAVGLLCKSLTSELRGELPPEAKIVPIRTGGDEIRLIVTGVEGEAQMQHLTDLMHAAVEKNVAAMGLQDHPHLKAPTDPVRNGFGVALAMQDMRQIDNPETLIQELDGRIKTAKTDLGQYRLGMIDEQALRTELQHQAQNGTLEIPKGQTAEQVINAKVAETAKLAQAASDNLHRLNPLHNAELPGGPAGFNEYVDKTMKALGPSPLAMADVPEALSGPKPYGANRPEGVAPFASLQDRWTALSEQQLEREGVKLSPVEKKMLSLSVSDLASTDPSAQTFMPKIVGPTVEAYAVEAEEFRKQWNDNDPKVKKALSAAGLTSVNELVPQAAAVSFHNLAGLNSALGHHQADLVLREMSAGIIEKSLNEAGIPKGPPQPYAIAHHGGGNFSVMIQPGGTNPDGTPWFASAAEVKQAEGLIAKHTEELNHVKIADFLEQKGVAVTQEMRDQLAKDRLSTFGDIQDPKLRKVGLVEGGVSGLHAVTDSAPMLKRERDGMNPGNGFGFMGRLRDNADAKMNALRDHLVLEQVVKSAVNVGVAQNAAAQKDAAPKKDGGKKGPGNKGGGGDGGGSAPVAPKKPVSPPPSLTAQKTPVPPPKTIEAKGTPPKPVTEPPAGGITSGQASKFTAKPPEEPVGGRKGAGVQSKAGHAVGVAQVGLDIAEGKYGQALQGAATQVALNPNTYKAAASLAEEAGTVAKALGFIGKKIPLVGAVVTAGFVLYEVGSNVKDGNYTKALTAAGAGTAEALGNLVGFGVGDVAREGVRETIVRTAGEEYAPNKSGLRTLVEQGIEVGSKFVGDKPAGQQQAINTAKPPGPKGKPPALG